MRWKLVRRVVREHKALARASFASRALRAVGCFCLPALCMSMNVAAQAARCSVSTQPLSFGSYAVDAITPLVTSSKVELRCSASTSIVLGIDGGANSPGYSASRQMRHQRTNEPLVYNVFQDASLSRVWGDGVHSAARSIIVDKTATVFAFAMIPAGQDVTFGEYRDALSIVVMP